MSDYTGVQMTSPYLFWNLKQHLGSSGVFASQLVGFSLWSGHTKESKNGTQCLSAWHLGLRGCIGGIKPSDGWLGLQLTQGMGQEKISQTLIFDNYWHFMLNICIRMSFKGNKCVCVCVFEQKHMQSVCSHRGDSLLWLTSAMTPT